MQSFLQRHASEIKGVLSGFDRIRFRGTIRWLASVRGMASFLGTMHVLLKDFNGWAKDRTERIRRASVSVAEDAGRPLIYLTSSLQRKEQLALAIAARDGIREGLICVLTCVEPCASFKVGPNKATHLLELRYGSMKCLHHYFYLLDRHLGLMHLRLQTWAPFTVHVCINGREWLARQLAAKRIPFQQRDNCFVDVGCSRRARRCSTASCAPTGPGCSTGCCGRSIRRTPRCLVTGRSTITGPPTKPSGRRTCCFVRARRWPTSIPGCCDTP